MDFRRSVAYARRFDSVRRFLSVESTAVPPENGHVVGTATL